ncbi:MAG: hypothetical protein MZW92_42455 [Comamonadaceae bacterium]|nr:hypothetical protein [Comamonadaceae bacterium]
MQSNGFTLAIVIMVGMGIALLYSLIAFALGKSFSLPTWADWLIPALIVIGIGVAAYLSYVETQSVEAMCGPVGDCNTVQQSRYARLFDVLARWRIGFAWLSWPACRLAGAQIHSQTRKACRHWLFGHGLLCCDFLALSHLPRTICHQSRVHLVSHFSSHRDPASTARHAARCSSVCHFR